MLKLYSIFHLNLAYSSIEEEQRKEVIEKCYWPLLKLATDEGIPLAIEATGFTLEEIQSLDPNWLKVLKVAIEEGKVEFIGSGYSQLIGPLVPANVNQWNLEIGLKVYEELVGVRPELWLINEQAYSAGLPQHYQQVGAKGIIMEWNNPASAHAEWPDEYSYYPQIASGINGVRLPLIWSNSISFQKFQRFAHDDISLKQTLDFYSSKIGKQERAYCLYCSDAEVFDFRPGRFHTEAALSKHSEWEQIKSLYVALSQKQDLKLVFPTDVFKVKHEKFSNNELQLESAAQPIPVKKQQKYNITRWALTGRDNLTINSKCHAINQQLKYSIEQNLHVNGSAQAFKKELCYLWASDFRTHITEKRWQGYNNRLEQVMVELNSLIKPQIETKVLSEKMQVTLRSEKEYYQTADYKLSRDDFFVNIETQSVSIKLNARRGLAIDSLTFPEIFSKPLIGTIEHGYFRDIALGADWYSANINLQRAGKPQLTDLSFAEIEFYSDENESIECVAKIKTELGLIIKKYTIYFNKPQIDISLNLAWEQIPIGSLRVNILTLFPEAFNLNELYYATHNGGFELERFSLNGCEVQHDLPASSVVSASHGLGITEGKLWIGDSEKTLQVELKQAECSAVPMLKFKQAEPNYLFRAFLSLGEMDESRLNSLPGPLTLSYKLLGIQGNF